MDDDVADDEHEDVTKLAAFNVKADRVEDFGFRIWWHLGPIFGSTTPLVSSVLPNSAAAKAGLKPGDRILKSDGKSAAITIFSLSKWRNFEKRKWAEITGGKKSVSWTLEVESVGSPATHRVTMTVPTPPPHWGAAIWQHPEGRPAAVVTEVGPLAERSRAVLDDGIAALFAGWVPRLLGLVPDAAVPFAGYDWRILEGSGEGAFHRIFVSQQRGRTDVVLIYSSREKGTFYYLTSPAGALERTWGNPSVGKGAEMALDEAREGFGREMDFWLNKVAKVSPRWPFGLIAGGNAADANIVARAPVAAPIAAPAATVDPGPRAASFLKLPGASEAQRALFADAVGKIGADLDRWAYTETSRGLDDRRVTVVRVDPSKPDAARCTLLTIDGKPPTPAQVQQWRDAGRDGSAALGDLPPIAGLVDQADLRIVADEVAAVVFELPLRGGNRDFPAEKFQARFRVNKAQRAFEDFAVKLRESFRVAGVVKVTDAGIEARFQTLDPALAPQPVLLRAGGGVSVLLVKLARSFESTRTEFKRVEPFDPDAVGALPLPGK